MWYDDATKELGYLGSWDLIHSTISYKPKIISRTLQGESNRSGACQEGGTANGDTVIAGVAKGGDVNVWARNIAAELASTQG